LRRTILKRSDFDKKYFEETDSEDVHSFIESRLIQLIGDTGRKLHTGRSRNDQVATAFRLWLREEISEISKNLLELQKTLIDVAEKQKSAVLPGYTHLQRAQPILWAHWCLAYFEMFCRDRERMDEVWRRVNILPLGSAALAGTAFEIDREAVAKELGFEGVTANSLDAVSDRDFAIEFVGACSLIMVHLSRFAEDLILYASSEFQFIELSDAVSTGSSLMPQKKNPDALELIRGKAGRIFGHQTALLSMMKGLPMAYNKDMQEDKEAVFDTVDTVKLSLQVADIVLKNLRLNEEKTRLAATKGYLNATELADYLVNKGIAFRTAHDSVGKIVLYAISVGKELNELELTEFQKVSKSIENDVFEALSLEKTLASKNQIGGTSPERVFEALDEAKNSLEMENE
jgi:argininosuccinate lyase